MAKRRRIPFFTDNDVADSVGSAIVVANHDLTRLRDVMLTSSPDPVVAAACRADGFLLVTHNYKDFRKIVREGLDVTKREANLLCRIELSCSQVIGARRMAEEMALIEMEWARHVANPSHGLRVTIADNFVRLNRDWVR